MQTAVEWLYDQLEFDDSISMDDIEEIFNQAKEMEKQQIEKSWWAGHDARDETFIHPSEDCNGYYNETFNNGTNK